MTKKSTALVVVSVLTCAAIYGLLPAWAQSNGISTPARSMHRAGAFFAEAQLPNRNILAAQTPTAMTIAFGSARALDGSNAATPFSTTNIWVMNPDGTEATPLTSLTAGRANSVSPVWSPDGSKLAFASARALDGSNAATPFGTTNIWVMNPDGTEATPLTSLTAEGANSTGPAWEP